MQQRSLRRLIHAEEAYLRRAVSSLMDRGLVRRRQGRSEDGMRAYEYAVTAQGEAALEDGR